MTDDDVKPWLNAEERWAFERALREAIRETGNTKNPDGTPRVSYVTGPWQGTIAALRTLAFARRVLAAMLDASEEAQQFCGQCPLCRHQHANHSLTSRRAHEPACIFATMPRGESQSTPAD